MNHFTMKKIYMMLMVMMTMGFTFTSCSEDSPFSTISADDTPRILDPVFPDRNGGELPVVSNYNRDGKFSMKVTVTPTDFTTVTWYIDGQAVATGTQLDSAFMTGTYDLKVVATTTAGKSTYREGRILVNPLGDDPQTITKGMERIAKPGQTCTLYGSNLATITNIKIGGEEVQAVANADGTELTYAMPADMTEGTYRIVLEDADAHTYGANQVQVFTTPVALSGYTTATPNSNCTITGLNLTGVKTLNIGGTEVSSFSQQADGSLTFVCPDLAIGTYTITGTTTDGKPLQFFSAGKVTVQGEITLSQEKTLWEGHHYVSWELADGNPNKTFNFLTQDDFKNVKAGSLLRIYYSLKTDDGYHQMETVTGWWSLLPGTAKTDLSSNGVQEVVLTQAVLDMINAQSGFLVVGHGFYVDRVTLK